MRQSRKFRPTACGQNLTDCQDRILDGFMKTARNCDLPKKPITLKEMLEAEEKRRGEKEAVRRIKEVRELEKEIYQIIAELFLKVEGGEL